MSRSQHQSQQLSFSKQSTENFRASIANTKSCDLLGLQEQPMTVDTNISLAWYEEIYVSFHVFFQSINYNTPSKKSMKIFLNCTSVTIVMTIITLWALYAEDFKIMFTDLSADETFSWIAFTVFIFFLVEWILASWSTEGYLFSFFFWLDFVATISLIPDIIFMAENLGFSEGGTADPSSARAGKAARAGTRAGRIVRIVRLVRIGKLSKPVFAWLNSKRKDNNIEYDEYDNEIEIADEEDFEDDQKPSNLGQRLSQLINKRVISGVLTMIFVVPWLLQSQSDKLYPIKDIITHLDELYLWHISDDPTAISSEIFNQYLDTFLEQYQNVNNFADEKVLVYLSLNSTVFLNNVKVIENLRISATSILNSRSGNIIAMFNLESIKTNDAEKSIILTSFLITMLTVLAVLFNHDTNTYVIKPIQKMVDSVKALTENPMAQQENNTNDNEQEFETAMLQGTIQRIGKLLQLGFGEAGAEIIKSSLSSNLSANVGGRHMNAIFGFCDIRQFTDTTECLQDKIMNFVNEIAEIVHGIAFDYGGAPNKNVGDAFLIVWSLPDDCQLKDFDKYRKYMAVENGDKVGNEVLNINQMMADENRRQPLSRKRLKIMQKVQLVADGALISFIKISLEIHDKNKSDFLKYKTHPRIIQRFGNSYEVKVGCGIHVGWAIEGAIGSRFKIDASYLSHNVNLSEDLEGATKFYVVPFLISEQMVNILSPFARSMCRMIDRILVSGVKHPFNLYCVDIWHIHKDLLGDDYVLDDEYLPTCGILKCNADVSDVDYIADADEEKVQKELLSKYTKSERNFFVDPLLNDLHEGFSVRFKKIWNEGLQYYLGGKWGKAREVFEEVLCILPTDGPCKALLGWMRKTKFRAPADWPGFREHS